MVPQLFGDVFILNGGIFRPVVVAAIEIASGAYLLIAPVAPGVRQILDLGGVETVALRLGPFEHLRPVVELVHHVVLVDTATARAEVVLDRAGGLAGARSLLPARLLCANDLAHDACHGHDASGLNDLHHLRLDQRDAVIKVLTIRSLVQEWTKPLSHPFHGDCELLGCLSLTLLLLESVRGRFFKGSVAAHGFSLSLGSEYCPAPWRNCLQTRRFRSELLDMGSLIGFGCS